MLVDGLKFDLRVYVTITGTEPLQAFVCEEGLARFCTEEYKKPTMENLKNEYMHLTNYSINKMSPNYKESDNFLEINDASKRTFTSLFASIDAMGKKSSKLKKKIRETASKSMELLAPFFMQGLQGLTNGNEINGKIFTVLGLDLFVDEDLDTYLLEVNNHPSFNIYSE